MYRILLLIVLLFFSGCGYKPLAYKSKDMLGDKIYIEVKINPRDPQNSIALKDELSRSIFERLHARIVDKQDSTSMIEVELQNVSFKALAENQTGFATFYRCEVSILFKYINLKTQKTRIFTKKGYYNFSLNETFLITDSVRLEAINRATLQALDAFISQVGVDGY